MTNDDHSKGSCPFEKGLCPESIVNHIIIIHCVSLSRALVSTLGFITLLYLEHLLSTV